MNKTINEEKLEKNIIKICLNKSLSLKSSSNQKIIKVKTLWFDLPRIGSETQVIKCWKIKDVLQMDFGMTFYFNLWENPF